MFCDVHRYIFVHINKTGGTSISKALADEPEPMWKHMTAAQYRKVLPVRFSNFFKFAFVRNPWDRMVSQYFFRVGDTGQAGHLADRAPVSFPEFLRDPFPLGHREQLSFISDDAGRRLVDFVGRFERLQADFDRVCDRLQRPRRTLPTLNQTQHGPYTDYYDDETRRLVAELYRRDIAFFGYRFGQ